MRCSSAPISWSSRAWPSGADSASILARNLLATLRGREMAAAAKGIAHETGLEHRPVADGERVAGVYRRSVHARQRPLRHARRRPGIQPGAVEAGD